MLSLVVGGWAIMILYSVFYLFCKISYLKYIMIDTVSYKMIPELVLK